MIDHGKVFHGLWTTLGEPPLTRDEAERAVRRLTRHVLGVPGFGSVIYPQRSTGHNTYRCGAAYTDCGAGWLLSVHPRLGWQAMVDVLGAYLADAYYRERDTPRGAFDRMRVRLTREIIKRGWLSGELAPQPKALPTKEQAQRERMKRLAVLENQWLRKYTRAENAIRKIHQERKRIERRLANDH